MQRPDMSSLTAEVIAYIEALEHEIAVLREQDEEIGRNEAPLEPSEAPTTINVGSCWVSRL